MKPSYSILWFLFFTPCIAGAIIAFNLFADPYCLRCRTVELDRGSFNPFYGAAQNLKFYSQTQQIVIGSSRAGAFSVSNIEKKTGLKTLNLTLSGANVYSKMTLIKYAAEHTRLSSVIWITDYFEFGTTIGIGKLNDTLALDKYIPIEAPGRGWWPRLGTLIDHNTIDASVVFLKRAPKFAASLGGASLEACRFKSPTSAEPLLQAINHAYYIYANKILPQSFPERGWNSFVRELSELKNIHFHILIPPYHPYFRERMKKEKPDVYEDHQRWIRDLMALRLPNVKVSNYFEGLPSDTPGPENWNDGDHFTCQAAESML